MDSSSGSEEIRSSRSLHGSTQASYRRASMAQESDPAILVQAFAKERAQCVQAQAPEKTFAAEAGLESYA